MRQIKVAPSLLAANPLRIGEEVKAIERAGADWLHVDIMDGHFVPNITFGPHLVKALKQFTSLPLDVHLMVTSVLEQVEIFAKAGADILTIHLEACYQVPQTLRLIRSLGCSVGVALKPSTPIDSILPYLEDLDMVLVMSVEPGFSGQSFLSQSLPKISALRQIIDDSKRSILIEVDGGIDTATCVPIIEAGADVVVAGTAIFSTPHYKDVITRLKGTIPC